MAQRIPYPGAAYLPRIIHSLLHKHSSIAFRYVIEPITLFAIAPRLFLPRIVQLIKWHKVVLRFRRILKKIGSSARALTCTRPNKNILVPGLDRPASSADEPDARRGVRGVTVQP
jgi:hypothetical protein